jgi:hypothetical protein
MRRLLTICIAVLCSLNAWATCGSGYTFHMPLKLIKASGSDQTNYPVRVWFRDYRIATVANGGNVQNTVSNSLGRTIPADLQFCPDLTGTGTPLKFEGVYYNGSYGDIQAWVQQPTYHTASFDTIYLYTNNAAVVTSQEDLTMWADANYFLVFHFPDGTTLDRKNSVTGTATTKVGTVNAAAQPLNGSASTSGSSGNYQSVARTAALEPAATLTLEALTYTVGTGGDGNNTVISKPFRTSGWSSPFLSYRLIEEASGTQMSMNISTSGSIGGSTTAALLRFSNWHYVTGTYDSALGSANAKSFIDGTSQGTANKTGNIDYSGGTTNLDIGTDTEYTTIDFFNGRMAELRAASDAKTANWIATSNNHFSPYKSNFVIDETTYAKPQIRQFASCGAASATASCVFPFDLTAGGTIVVLTACLNGSCSNPCPSMSNDSAGLAYTVRASSSTTGTLQHYYACLYTAPIGATTGADTVTIPTGDQTSAVVFETKGTTTTSAVYVSAPAESNTPTLTGTSPANDSLLICGTDDGTNGGPGTTVTPTSLLAGNTPQVVVSAAHYSVVGYAWGLVASGSQSCQFGTGTAGVMAILPSAPVSSATVRHRSSMY